MVCELGLLTAMAMYRPEGLSRAGSRNLGWEYIRDQDGRPRESDYVAAVRITS